MKKIGIILLAIVLVGIGGYYLLVNSSTWSTTETLDGYDSKAAAEETPVESFQNNNTQSNSGNGLNPAHGQPGHRCDIAVGAPLTSPSSNSSMLNSDTMLNPAHGQPGHRCDIAVGAPLPTS